MLERIRLGIADSDAQSENELHPQTAAAAASYQRVVDLQLGLDADTLVTSLSDNDSNFLVGEKRRIGERLNRLQKQWFKHRRAAARSSQSKRSQSLEQFGVRAFRELLPERLKSYFADAPACDLRISLDASLAMIPWELLFDGTDYWRKRHRITRAIRGESQLVGAGNRASDAVRPLKILLVCAEQHLAEVRPYAQRLEQLGSAWRDVQIALTSAKDFHLATNRGGDSGYNVVHWIGAGIDSAETVAAVWQRLSCRHAECLTIIDWFCQPPDTQNWIIEGRLFAKFVTQANCVISTARSSWSIADADQVARIYERVISGLTIGESVQPVGQKYPADLDWYALYGSYNTIIFPAIESNLLDRGYRQVTSLSYDLAGSTSLMERIGPEQYSLKLSNCHQRFAEIVARWGGVSDIPQGDDGIMCYFGAKQSTEDSVRSAAFAGLAIIEAASKLGVQVRVGIATGQVAVGGGQYVGLSVHLAARIQSTAKAGEVLISASTAELIQGFFSVTPYLHEQSFKGFATPMTIFQVNEALSTANRPLEVAGPLTRMVGRDPELKVLEENWRVVQAGQGRWLHITGEAGIGKSRLISSFRASVGHEPDVKFLVCRCYPETRNQAFGSIIDMVARWFQIQTTDDLAAREAKLERDAPESELVREERIVLSFLLGLSIKDAPNLPSTANETRRQFQMRTMVSWLIGQAQKQSLCLVVEDLQWADPSTLEYLDRLRLASREAKLLTILTERVDFNAARVRCVPELADQHLGLQRLSLPSVREMINNLSAGSAISRERMEMIEAKSDGIPLFVEMSTQVALKSGMTEALGHSPSWAGEFPVPTTVRDLLMQRLDSLKSARVLAQMCSAIGREFPARLLDVLLEADVGAFPRPQANDFLRDLLESGLLLCSGDANTDSRRYYFRHALVHEVAYQSMWETDRRTLHFSIARAIETKMPELASMQPEVLASHYQASNSAADGAKWHWLAARKWKAVEAFSESLYHLNEAKHLMSMLAQTPDRSKSMLDLELAVAGQLIATKGYGSDAAGQSYRTALDLAEKLNDRKALLRAQLGLEAYHLMRADFDQALAYLEMAQTTAREFNDALTRIQCLFALANIRHHQGWPQAMLSACDQCLVELGQAQLRGKLVQSPEVMTLMYSSVCLWEIGEVDKARDRARLGVDVAQRLGQRLALGQALGMQAMVLQWCGETKNAMQVSERAISVCSAGAHDMWSAHAQFIFGYSLSKLGEALRGLALMDSAYELWTSTGTVITRTFYLSLRAAVCLELRQVDRGLKLIEEAESIVRLHGERYYEPEVFRVKGELLCIKAEQTGEADLLAADVAFASALESALALGYRSLALRAATSLARRRIQSARISEAIELLQDALGRLTQGADTEDQRFASDLLEQLRSERISLKSLANRHPTTLESVSAGKTNEW